MTFQFFIHVLCFILEIVLLALALISPEGLRVRLMEAIVATALVAWLCSPL